MVAHSRVTDTAWRGVDLSIGFRYRPPDGETLAEIAFSAALHALGRAPTPADEIEADPATGEVVATWQEATTAKLVSGAKLEARFVRRADGDTRVLFIRQVNVR